MLCARAKWEDSCQGDSGQPLVIKGGDTYGASDVQRRASSRGASGARTLTFRAYMPASLWRRITSRQKSAGGADSRLRPGSIAAPTDQAATTATVCPTQKISLAAIIIASYTSKAISWTTCLTQYRHCLAAAKCHYRKKLQ
jgi:hypothetical protein